MAHYAFLDENNFVTEIIVWRNEDEVIQGISNWEEHYGQIRGQVCKRTSYNSNIRKNFATIGSKYDEILDAFIPLSPFLSWVFNEDLCNWQAPVAMPTDDKLYVWNEETISWDESAIPTE